MANTYNRTEVEDLLRALERNATAVIDAARASATEAQQDKFTGYANFKERCDDFDTLSILIEYRLKNMRGGREQDLEEKFDELTVYMVSATLTTSLHDAEREI
ncbi:MAG: hypothetical protein HY057_01575 [Rhodospirillales bacterium]|nr:hypothetical protein [Rhodospirillales bacterium]